MSDVVQRIERLLEAAAEAEDPRGHAAEACELLSDAAIEGTVLDERALERAMLAFVERMKAREAAAGAAIATTLAGLRVAGSVCDYQEHRQACRDVRPKD